MQNELKRKQAFLIGLTVGLAAVFSYGFYSAMGKVSSTQREYIEKYRELISVEEKQKQAANLEKELMKNSAQIGEIKKALIEQTYENKLHLVIAIENAAKSFGLSYELSIGKELTKEFIAAEKARLARSRRGSQQVRGEPIAEQFPGIVFNLKLDGSYRALVGFIEKLQALPYYMDIENFSITRKGGEGEEGGKVEATLQILVFTM